MAGNRMEKISFGQFPAIALTSPSGVKLNETAQVDEPSAHNEDVVVTNAAFVAAPVAPAAAGTPTETTTVENPAARHADDTQVDEAVAEIPEALVADGIPDTATQEGVPEDLVLEEDPAVHFTEEDLLEARERAELSLLARIFWDDPRELRVVENSFIQVWKCGRVRIFDVGYGLYQFIFPSVTKRNWVLENQPWFFQRSIIHFSDVMTPSEELFHSLQFMLIWVKIIGLPFSYLTIAVGRKLLAKLGEVVKVGYFDAGTPEGCYIKGRVRMDLLGSFLGTAPVTGVNGASFPAFFQYIGLPCICYLCGWLGHVMADCTRTDLVFDANIRSDWICGKVDLNEKESQGPQLQSLPVVPAPLARGRGGLPPSVAARLSSNLQRQWQQDRQRGGARGRFGRGPGGPRPLLALPGPDPLPNLGPGRNSRGSGPPGARPRFIRPLQILAPGNSASNGLQGRSGPIQADGNQAQAQTGSAASFVSSGRDLGQQPGPSSASFQRVQPPPCSSRQQLDQRLKPAEFGLVGSSRASSAPGVSMCPADVPLGRRLDPMAKLQETPQSKLMEIPGPSRRSTPSSGSVKRKLLEVFESADGPPSNKTTGPKAPSDWPIPLYGKNADGGLQG
ncbi:hypothetical protein LINPERHAP2_LOCUS27883 [Linum perenne]